MNKYINKDLVALINKEFNLSMSEQKLKAYLANHKLKRTVSMRKAPPNRVYSPDVVEYVKKNIKGVHYNEMADRLNKLFGLNTTAESLKSFCIRNKCCNGVETKYKNGNVPHNKGQKGYYHAGQEKGWFKQGHKPVNYMPLGSVTIINDGYLAKKIAEPNKWEFLSVHIWKEAGREIPKGSRLIFRDGDPMNCTLENLMVVPLRYHMQLNMLKLRSKNGDITETQVNLLKLRDAIRKRENGKANRKKDTNNS
ncbi:MAG: HNH endonuclease [Prevotellaceae bacterium]|nr:HNH endonuclease [Candidatus Faecinaster equi]